MEENKMEKLILDLEERVSKLERKSEKLKYAEQRILLAAQNFITMKKLGWVEDENGQRIRHDLSIQKEYVVDSYLKTLLAEISNWFDESCQQSLLTQEEMNRKANKNENPQHSA